MALNDHPTKRFCYKCRVELEYRGVTMNGPPIKFIHTCPECGRDFKYLEIFPRKEEDKD